MMPDVPSDEELTPLDSALKPAKPTAMAAATAMPGTASAAASPALRGTSADPSAAPAPAPSSPTDAQSTLGGEMRKAAGTAFGLPGALATGAVKAGDLARTAAFGAGEAAGGPWIAGVTSTAYDALSAFYENWKHGTPIPPDANALIKTFGINTLTSLLGSGLTSGLPSEAKAIVGKADEAEAAHVALGQGLAEKAPISPTPASALGTVQPSDILAKLDEIKQSQLGEVSPAAQVEAIQKITGRTADDAQAAKFPPTEATVGGSNVPSPAELEKQGGLASVYFTVKHRIGDDLGGQIGAFRNQVKGVLIGDIPEVSEAESIPKSSLKGMALHEVTTSNPQLTLAQIKQEGLKAGWLTRIGGKFGTQVGSYDDAVKAGSPVLITHEKNFPLGSFSGPDDDYVMPRWRAGQESEYLGDKEFGNAPPERGVAIHPSKLAEYLGTDPKNPNNILIRPLGRAQSGLDDLQQVIATQQQYRKANLASYSPAVSKLYAQAKKISGMTLDEDEEKMITGSSKKTYVAGEKGMLSEMRQSKLGEDDDLVPMPKKPATLGNIVALKAKAARLAAVSHDDVSAHAASELDEAADRILDREVPPDMKKQWDGVKSQYSNYKKYFPRTDSLPMQRTKTSDEAADRLFNSPNLKLADRVIANAKPAELKTLQDGFGDWARNNPEKVLAKGADRNALANDARDKALVYGRLFPGTPFADPKAITYVSGTVDNIEASPIQKANWERSFQQSQQKAVKDAAPDVVKLGYRFADDIGGPVGESYRKQIESANTKGGIENGPQAAADKTIELYTGFNRQQFVQDLASEQPRFGASIAKQATGGIYIKRMISDPTVTPYIAGIGLAQAAVTGRAGWYGMLAAAAAPLSARRFVTNTFVKSLESPEKAAALLNGTKAAKIGIMGPLADTAVKATYDEVASSIAKKLTGVTMERQPDEDEEAEGAEAAR